MIVESVSAAEHENALLNRLLALMLLSELLVMRVAWIM